MMYTTTPSGANKRSKYRWKVSDDAPVNDEEISFNYKQSGGGGHRNKGAQWKRGRLKLHKVLAVVISVIGFSAITNIVRNSVHTVKHQYSNERKRRLCESRKLLEESSSARASSSTTSIPHQQTKHKQENKDKEKYANGGSLFTDLVDRVLETTAVDDLTEEDCETVYPAEVAAMSGPDYYADPEGDSGLYYRDEIPAPALDAELQGTQEEIDPFILNPDVNDTSAITAVDTNLLDLFKAKEYNPVNETNRPNGTTAYTVVISSCPDDYNPAQSEVTDPGNDIFEASAMLKQFVCNITDSTVVERRRQRKLRGLQEDDVADEAIANYTMYALVHPQAVNCPNPDGTTYNRVELLQQQGYHVEIVGHPITDVDLADKQPYIKEHIEEDVGVRDTMALHAFNLEEHNAVVLLDYNTQLQHSIQDEIDELVHNPSMQVKYVKDKDDGVSKGFMILKPSRNVFNTYRNDYLNTMYSPTQGWGNQGLCTCAGYLGLKGYFAYRSQIDPMWHQLDRCTYNNQLDNYCINSMDAGLSRVVRHSNSVCGLPRDCPYTLSTWSDQKKTACGTVLNNYMRTRIQLETEYLIKQRIQERFGRYRFDTFMGYCDGPGSNNYMGITRKIRLRPTWQSVCPPTICGPGQYMKPDCTCTWPHEDPCNACPLGTRCQRYPELMCIDCECGFCDFSGQSCCGCSSGYYNNQCHSQGPGDHDQCNVPSNNFPALGGYVDVCNGMGYTVESLPNGCGCKPSATLPCEYNKDLQGVYDDKCFMCTVHDFSQGKCTGCVQCLKQCHSCIYDYFHYFVVEGYSQHSLVAEIESYKWCLGMMSSSCRQSCTDQCRKF